jgi:hypothetical protein
VAIFHIVVALTHNECAEGFLLAEEKYMEGGVLLLL